MVTRALDVSLLTGELIICKHQDELGDPGLRRLEQRLVRAEPSPAYRQNSTLTCTARACRAADSQPASAPVQVDCSHIVTLSVENHGIGVPGALALAAGLRGHAQLEHLVLRQNCIQSEGAEALVAVLEGSSRLRVVDVSDNRIGPRFTRGLVRCAALETLSLQHNLYECVCRPPSPPRSTRVGTHASCASPCPSSP